MRKDVGMENGQLDNGQVNKDEGKENRVRRMGRVGVSEEVKSTQTQQPQR